MSYDNRLSKMEKEDGVMLISSRVASSFHLGIKDGHILMISKDNGEFCCSSKLLPFVLKEVIDVYNTYFAPNGEQLKLMRKGKVKASEGK